MEPPTNQKNPADSTTLHSPADGAAISIPNAREPLNAMKPTNRQSKLANAVFTYALHDRLAAKGSKVKALVCAPGVATTALISSTANDGSTPPGFLFRALAPLMGGIAQSSEDGAMPLLTCMCMPGIESGDFYEPANRFKGLAKKYVIEDYCKSKENKDLLWDASEEAIGEKWAI